MAELKRNFTSSRMNKDLDERLVPNGEYRDALNISISTSESSDEGSVESIKGNSRIGIQAQDRSFTQTLGITGQKCIGTVRDEEQNKIYWFISGTNVDAIAEYDENTNSVASVFTDLFNFTTSANYTNSPSNTITFNTAQPNIKVGAAISGTNVISGTTVASISADNKTITLSNSGPATISGALSIVNPRALNFSPSMFITAANILDGILYFTDNINEPKQIDINKSKLGTPGFSSSTILRVKSQPQDAALKEHITLIKKSPLNAPNITMSNSLRGGIVNSTFTSASNFFGDTNGSKAPGTELGDIIFSPKPSFEVGDNLKFTHSAVEEAGGETILYEVRVVLTSLESESAVAKTFKSKILSITDDVIHSANVQWDVALEQKDPFFELVFPRFAYRWKYENGQYSAFSPFSEVAFLPDEVNGYKFDSKSGFNKAMVNTVRKITLSTFDTKPKDAVEVDVLFKQSNNTNVYTVKTLKNNEDTIDITSEQIYATVPSNQLIRPYDNVPRKALSQDVVGNRLVFGNYIQNYNIEDEQTDDGKISSTVAFQTNVLSNKITENTPTKSLKAIRKYQLGVIYLDEFGRHTPVFSDDTGVITIDQIQSNTANKIEAKITTPAPSWATHYRYYIKEPSNEYYNLALDRYYEAEDGNVWLSFSSADRNKVDNETFLILKKKHTENVSVFNTSGGTVKYKILDIANEAPTFIKQKKTSLGKITTQFGENSNAAEGFPQKGFLSFKVKGSEINVLKDLNTTSVTDKYIRISTSSNASELYQLSSINVNDAGTTGDLTEAADTWTFNIAEAFGSDIDFVGTGTSKTAGLSLEVLQEEIDENNPEFVGRFFVKVPRDATLDKSILTKAVDRVYKVKNAQNIFKIDTQHDTKADFSDTQLFAIDRSGGFDEDKNALAVGKGAQAGKKTIQLRLIGIGPDKEPHTLFPNVVNLTANAQLDGQLRAPGTLLRWRSDGSTDNVYEIISSSPIKVFNYGTGPIRRKKADNKGIRYTITLDRELSFNAQNAVQSGVTSDSGTSTVLEVVSEVINENTFSSDSPAVFETEPKQAVDLDLYYETSKTYPIADLATSKTLDYFNCFSFGNGVESNRIRDDFNAPTIDKGVRVSTVLAEQYREEHKKSGLIYSGIYNSTSGINRLNQFIAGEKITKDLNPEYGSIQKLHTRNTDLIALCEDKVLKILANKDALFNADGNVNLTSTNNVLGTAIPFAGEYGIAKNPESFASYGYRAYFTDKARGVVLRLSMDGLTKISDYGMGNYFTDNLTAATTVLGTYDEDGNNYNVTLNNDTVSFAESINGWESRKSYIPEAGISLNKTYYTFSGGDMWKHTDTATRNTFYGGSFVDSQITLLLNDLPSSIKKYKTINYEGSRSREYNASGAQTKTGWYLNNITTDQQSGEIQQFKDKENKWYNYIKGKAISGVDIDTKNFNIQGVGKLSALSGNGQSLFNLSITVNTTGKLMTLTGVSSDNAVWTLDGNTATCTGVGQIADTDPVVLTFTADENCKPPSAQSVDSLPSEFNGQPVYNATNNTLTITFNSETLTANKNINITPSAACPVETFTISGTFDVDVNNTTGSSSTNNAYSGDTANNAEFNNLIDQTFTASADHYFFSEPQIIFTDVKHRDNYKVIVTDTNDSDGNLTARRFQVSYTIRDKESVTTDKIRFVARAINNQASTGKLYNFTCDQTDMNFFGAERVISVYGDPTATYKLSISDGSNTYDFSSNTFTSSSTESGTLTIGTQGSSSTTIDFPSVTANKTYTTTITAVGGGVSWNTGNATTRTFTIDQKKEVFIRFTPTNVNAIDGSNGNQTITPSNITVTSTAGDTQTQRVLLEFTVTETNDIVLLSTPQYSSFSGDIASTNNTTRELTLNDGGKVTIDNHSITLDNNSTPKSATYRATALISQFGTDNDTVNINLANHLSAGLSSNQYVTLAPTVAANDAGETNLTGVTFTSGSQVLSSADVATGTGEVTGDFSEFNIDEVTINVQAITDSSQIQGFGLSTSTTNLVQSVQPTSLTATKATFNWAATLIPNNTVANNEYNVAISVDLIGV